MRVQTTAATVVCLAICVVGMSWTSLAAPPARKGPAAPSGAKVLSGIDAVRYLYGKHDYAQAQQYACRILWDDIGQPEALDILVRCLEARRKKDEAAVFNKLLLRVLEENDSKAEIAKYRATALKRRAVLDQPFERLTVQYSKAAAGKRFKSPDEVDDLWMTQVRSDLAPLHGLYAWTLVGGRKDVSPDWIHNRQGAMHWSGAKYVEEVDGRKGVLFATPLKADARRAQRLGHPPRIYFESAPAGKFLRIGTKAYNFPYVLRVYLEGQQIFSQTIAEKSWTDLKIELKAGNGRSDTVMLELFIPPEQRWAEGAWFDYIDFFEN